MMVMMLLAAAMEAMQARATIQSKSRVCACADRYDDVFFVIAMVAPHSPAICTAKPRSIRDKRKTTHVP